MLFGSSLMTAGGKVLPWWRTDPTVYAALPFGAYGFADVKNSRTITKVGNSTVNGDGDLQLAVDQYLSLAWPRARANTAPTATAMWVKYSSFRSGVQKTCAIDSNASYNRQYVMHAAYSSGEPSASIWANCNGGYATVSARAAVQPDAWFAEWHHIAGIIYHDGATKITVKLYVDGQLSETVTGTYADATFPADRTTMTMCHGVWQRTTYFRDVLMGERDWTDDDVAALFAAGRGNMWSA